jgi:glycosyltransferase involved in cell wall biosynthesis
MAGIPTTETTTAASRLTNVETTRKLRVLFVSHAYVVGVNQGKLNAIAQTENIEVGLLAPSNWKALEWNRPLPLENPYSKLHLYSAPVLFPGKGGAHIYAPWDLWRILNTFKPDILQVEEEVFSLSTFELALWSRLTKTPMIVFGWENLERQLPAPRQQVCQFVLNTVKAIIPGNQDGANIMRQWGYSGLLEVMPQMGVDPDFFSPRERQGTTYSGESEGSDRPFNIGYLGRLAQAKGIDLIFAAVRELQQRGLNVRITLCGSGADEETLKQEANNQKVANIVTWRGAVRHEQAPQELGTFDVLVLPSRTTPGWKEQFGHVLIEAMAMGIPVVGSSSGEIPNVIGRSDLVFQEEDFKGLAEILEHMIRDPAWYQSLGKYGLDRTHQLYTHKQIARRLIELWRSVLEKSAKADGLVSVIPEET